MATTGPVETTVAKQMDYSQILPSLFVGTHPKTAEDTPSSSSIAMNTPEPVDPSKLRTGPIRHESLSAEVLKQIRAVYDVIGPYVSMPLEQFEIGFMRDMYPEREVAVWLSITAAWLDYHERYVGDELLPKDDEKKLVAALIVISTGVEDVNKFGVAEEVGRKLRECYSNLGKK